MTFSVKITGYSETEGQMLMMMEPHWWDAEELVKDKRFVECDKRKFYRDYEADLSLDEVRELHERYKGNVTTLQKFLCFRFKKLSSPCQKLYGALFRSDQNISHFHINVFEWESGL
jgi:hypothetical protein